LLCQLVTALAVLYCFYFHLLSVIYHSQFSYRSIFYVEMNTRRVLFDDWRPIRTKATPACRPIDAFVRIDHWLENVYVFVKLAKYASCVKMDMIGKIAANLLDPRNKRFG
jgi:hypothetical protein